MKKLLASLMTVLFLVSLLTAGCAAGYQPYASETLMRINEAFFSYMLALSGELEEVDMIGTTGIIQYNDNSFTYSYDDVGVIHGGAYSEKNTVSLGVGTGLDENEDHWYMSLTFSPEASGMTLYACGYSLLYACAEVGLQLPEDNTESNELVGEILDTLFSTDQIAIETDGLVLIHKTLDGGSHLLAVDSLPYYNGFYYNSIENYFKID